MDFVNKTKKILNKIGDSWKDYPFFASIGVFILVFLLYASIYLNNPGISALDDHFFHFKYAYLIRTQGWGVVNNFNWVAIEPGGSGRYQLMLYNLALIPFTFIKNMVLGLKISDIFWASLSVSGVYYAFRKFKVIYPLFWIFALISIIHFDMRMLLGRSLVLVPALLMLELYFAKEKKYGKFFLISLLHVAWHTSTFFLPLVIAILIEASRILAGGKFFWRNPLAAIFGSLVGLKLISYSISGLIQVVGVQLLATQSANDVGAKIEGNELYPRDIFKLLGASEILLILLSVSFLIVIYYYLDSKKNEDEKNKERNIILYGAFLFALMSFSGTLIASGRFYDFYFISVIFLAAVVSTILLEKKDLIIKFSLKKYILSGFIIFFLLANADSFLNLRQAIAKTDYRPTGEIANWIADKSNENDRIFLIDWSSFPAAFFYNSKNVYNVGIEPKGALMANPASYWKWYNMFVYGFYCDQPESCVSQKEAFDEEVAKASNEQQKELKQENSRKIIESIKKDFGAHFVLTGNAFASILELDPELIKNSHTIKSEYNGSTMKGLELK